MEDKKVLYEAVKNWLKSNGYKALVAGGKYEVIMPVKDLFPIKAYIMPDVVGIKDSPVSYVVVVEVGTDLGQIYELIVKCMLWKITATCVYIAYPKDKCPKLKLLERFGIGLLSISDDGVQEVIKIMPKESIELHKVLELHPLDHAREQELLRQIERRLELLKEP